MSGADAVSLTLILLAFGYLAVISVALGVIDVRTHRLPNRIVLSTGCIAIALFVGAGVAGGDFARVVNALAGMLVLFAGYVLMRWASPGSIGGGDVKLAGVIGLYLGWLGWGSVLVGTAAAFLIGGIHAVVLLTARRADRRTRIPFGPALLGGAWVAIAVAVIPPALATTSAG